MKLEFSQSDMGRKYEAVFKDVEICIHSYYNSNIPNWRAYFNRHKNGISFWCYIGNDNEMCTMRNYGGKLFDSSEEARNYINEYAPCLYRKYQKRVREWTSMHRKLNV